MLKPFSGFTLIELLIVVAIIAILAAIAVPNLLEAQVRAKVSRVKSDLRTLTTALEAYRVDANEYPLNDGVYNVTPMELSTPVAYISNSMLLDPFTDKDVSPVFGTLVQQYTYHLLVTMDEFSAHVLIGRNPPVEAIEDPGINPDARAYYGRWKLLSNGPDRIYSEPGTPASPWNVNPGILLGADEIYDPTNGTVSFGNIIRTQRHSDGLPAR